MNRARGIDVVAVIGALFLTLEGVGIFLAQLSIWPNNRWVAVHLGGMKPPLGSSAWVPAMIAAAGALFALEAVMRKRPEPAVFTRVIVAVAIAVGLLVAAVLGFATGAAYVTMPVG